MSDPIFKFDLGDQVKDPITRLEGVIIARSQWMNLCVRYAVQPRELHDGKIVEDVWFDEAQLESMKGTKNLAPVREVPVGAPVATTGGPVSSSKPRAY